MSMPRCQWGVLAPDGPDGPACSAESAATIRLQHFSPKRPTVAVWLCREHADYAAHRLFRAVALVDPEGDKR